MATDTDESSKQTQPYSDSENITDTVYDVKVCDICGDAGQKDSLAICNRCSDGAEHIYCMETMLDELPDGDWLCEECKFKDYENQKVHKFEIVTKTQDSYLDEDAQLGRSTIFSEAPPKKDGSLVKEDIADSRTLQISEIPSMRHGLNVDLNTVTCEKSSIRSPVSAESSVPRDVSLLSPGDPDSATKMPSNPERLSRSWSILKGQKAQTSSGSSRDGFKVISGPQLKPSSFKNTSTKPKVKQLLGAIPLAEIATGKAPYKNARKGGQTRGMVKSTSFKTEKGVCNGFESVNEKRSAKLTQIRNSNVEWNIELGVTERENSSASDIHQVVDRGLIDRDKSGYNREIPLYSSRSSINASSNGLNLQFQKQGQILNEGFLPSVNFANNSHKPDTVSQHNNHLRMESTKQDDIVKVAAISTTSNKPISGGSRIIHCQKCNETGHSTQLCLFDKQCVSAIKLSAEKMPFENAIRSNKCEPAGEKIMSKQEALKCTNTSFVFDKSKSTRHPDDANETEIHSEAGAGRFNSFGSISKELNVKHSEQVLPSIDPCLSNTLRTSVIPELEFFWQGGFEVLRVGRLPERCDGLQAHFSCFASGKVLEAAKKFPPYKVQLEEAPCVSFWPPHFHGNLAKDQNIALFFFAKDMESYRSNYCKLLEKMLKFDLALKGNLGGFELLIFPSNKLSENSQRWNRLLFLWGTFKGSSSSLEVLPNGKKDPFKSTMDAKLPATLQEASASPALYTGIENKICNANKYLCHTSVDAKLQSENQHPSPLVNLPAIASQVPSLHHSCSESSMQRKTTVISTLKKSSSNNKWACTESAQFC